MQEENTEKFSLIKEIIRAILKTFLILTIIFGVLMLCLMPALNSHVKHSKLSSINSSVTAISKSANSALVEMDENEYFIGGTHIICSERERNITDDTLDEDIFYEYMNKYFKDVRCKWFVVIEDGKITYSVAQSQKMVGSHPNLAVLDRGPAFYDGTYKSKKADLDDLYKYVRDNLNK